MIHCYKLLQSYLMFHNDSIGFNKDVLSVIFPSFTVAFAHVGSVAEVHQ